MMVAGKRRGELRERERERDLKWKGGLRKKRGEIVGKRIGCKTERGKFKKEAEEIKEERSDLRSKSRYLTRKMKNLRRKENHIKRKECNFGLLHSTKLTCTFFNYFKMAGAKDTFTYGSKSTHDECFAALT